jgi:hypothetical protein
MRHFFVFRPVKALALSVGMTASPAILGDIFYFPYRCV